MANVDLSVDLLGVKLANPTILASGILGVTTGTMKRVHDAGCAAITLKSISHEARPGYPNPTMLATDHFFMNAVGLSGVGVDKSEKKVKTLKDAGIPVIASIFADSFERTAEVGAKFEAYGADLIEINVSCPHTKPGENIGSTIGCDPYLVSDVTSAVKARVKIPVIVKLTPNVTDIVGIARAAVDAGADGLTAVNTFGPGLKVDIETGQPVLYNKLGGVSGMGIFPLMLAIVWRLRQALPEIPIIASGGITTASDAIETIMAGATAVSIGTAVYYEGIEVFGNVVREMEVWMAAHNYHSLDEIRGMALR
jgi:dihydroorotate dehydrogenase (NAD+) catalytic subunit